MFDEIDTLKEVVEGTSMAEMTPNLKGEDIVTSVMRGVLNLCHIQCQMGKGFYL